MVDGKKTYTMTQSYAFIIDDKFAPYVRLQKVE